MNAKQLAAAERKLKLAREQLDAKQRDSRLAEASAKYANRCFVHRQRTAFWKGIYFHKFGKITYSMFNSDRLEAPVETLYAIVETRKGSSLEGPGYHVTRKLETLETRNLMDLTEIPVTVYDSAKLHATEQAQGVYAGLIKLAKLPAEVEESRSSPDPVEIDLPHALLEVADMTILDSNCPYMLPGYVYLLTPSSRRWAAAVLDKAHRDLFRGSQYFQECDRHYVDERDNRIIRLRGLLT